MISYIVLAITIFLFAMVFAIVLRAVIRKQSIIGRPPIPVFFFVLAKLLVIVNLTFLLLRGLQVSVSSFLEPVIYTDLVALVFLIGGTVILILSSVQLKNDLIFGLNSSGVQKLQTKGIYSFSRHPFYLGFILILFSSCLLTPNYINIIAFAGAWFIHHFIMKEEEKFLVSQYGEEYRQYAKKVKRYLSFS